MNNNQEPRRNNNQYRDRGYERNNSRSPNRQYVNRGNNYNRRNDYDDEYYNDNRSTKSSSKWLLVGAILAGVIFLAVGISMLMPSKARVLSVVPAYQTSRSCGNVTGTRYVKNQKNGTEGAVIGGIGGALAGGAIGNAIGRSAHNAGAGELIGAVAGGAAGAYAGDEIQKSNQPNTIARRTTRRVCRPVQQQIGYTVQYAYKDNINSILVSQQIPVGTELPLQQLQAMSINPQQ